MSRRSIGSRLRTVPLRSMTSGFCTRWRPNTSSCCVSAAARVAARSMWPTRVWLSEPGGSVSSTSAAVADDRRQDVVEVVRDATGEPPERLHLLHAPQSIVEPLELGDLVHQRQDARLSVEIDELERHDRVVDASRAIAHRDLEVADRADGLQRLEQRPCGRRRLHPEVELVAGAAAHLGDGVAGQRLQRRVAVDEAAVGEAGDADARWSRRERPSRSAPAIGAAPPRPACAR